MKAKRKGNDIAITWRIVQAAPDGSTSPYNLEGKDLEVSVTVGAKTYAITDYSVSSNVLSFTFYGKDQDRTGVATLLLVENDGEIGMHSLDKVDAFQLTSHTGECSKCDDCCCHVDVEVLDLVSVIAVIEESAIPETIARKAWVNEQLTNYYTKSEADAKFVEQIEGKGLSTEDYSTEEKSKLGELPTNEELQSALGGKVDKEVGKGLSTNDFTDAYIARILALESTVDNIQSAVPWSEDMLWLSSQTW